MSNKHTQPLVNGIYNNDQSPFNNITVNTTHPISVAPIAVVSNITKTSLVDNDVDVVIDLVPINLTFEELVTLFYNNSGHNFSISASNVDNNAVSFLNQKYNTTMNKQSIFSLYDQFIKAWCKKHNKAESTLSFVQLIELQRNVFLTRSINNLGIYTLGLSLDEVLQNLLTTGKIKPVYNNYINEYCQGVPVEFIIQARVFSPALEIIIYVNFHYNVKIPCFTQGDVVSETIQQGAAICMDNYNISDDNTLLSTDLESTSICNRDEYDMNNSEEASTVYSEISKIFSINTDNCSDVLNPNLDNNLVMQSDKAKW